MQTYTLTEDGFCSREQASTSKLTPCDVAAWILFPYSIVLVAHSDDGYHEFISMTCCIIVHSGVSTSDEEGKVEKFLSIVRDLSVITWSAVLISSIWHCKMASWGELGNNDLVLRRRIIEYRQKTMHFKLTCPSQDPAPFYKDNHPCGTVLGKA